MTELEKTELENFTDYLIAKGYSRLTTQGILKDSRCFIKWLQLSNIEPDTLHYNDITAYLSEIKARGVSLRTQQTYLINTGHYLNYLVQAEIIPYNPALALHLKNVRHKHLYTVFTPEELERMYMNYPIELPEKKHNPFRRLNELSRKRNKVIIGFIIYQGLDTADISVLKAQHLQLQQGKLHVPAGRRSNERSLTLEARQVMELYDYLYETRKALLQKTKKQSEFLIVSSGPAANIYKVMQEVLRHLKQKNPHIKSLDQLRASVITNWLKQYNKRKVQYMAGHRYISSTEHYEANNIEALQEDVEKYYPVL